MTSFGYADKLTYREDLGGSLGDEEILDPKDQVDAKVEQLAALIRDSNRIAAFTGAGISKAAGVPDFRGPTGIWTLQRAGKPIPQLEIAFGAAKPTVTHQVLVALQAAGKLTCVISQNVDGLHTRSGIERHRLAELHGSCFVEKCGRCQREYVRDFELDTVGFKRTGRSCECGGRLRDNCLDWENALPDEDYKRAIKAAEECDLLLCLGSSLRITPACELPEQAVQAGGKLVIINLQATQHDKLAHLHLHAKCEDVMGQLAVLLGLMPLPAFCRVDTVRVTYIEEVPPGKASTGFELRISSCASDKHVTPLLRSVEVSFPDAAELDDAHLVRPPFQMRRRIKRLTGSLRVLLRLHLSKDADADKREVVLEPVFQLGPLVAQNDEQAADVTSRACAKRRRVAEVQHTQPQTRAFTFQTQHATY